MIGADRRWLPESVVFGRRPGTCDIRVHVNAEVCVFYVTTFPEAVYVLHVFQKKTRETSARDLALADSASGSAVSNKKTK
jgi:phage-related protein